MRNVTKIPSAAESAPQFRTNRAHPLERRQHQRLFLSIGLLLCFASLAFGEGQVTQNFAMPVQVHAAVGFSNCSNSPGPQITLDGSISLGGLNVDLIFRNNDNPVRGPHEAIRSAYVSIIPAGFTLTIPKQPVLGGVGGNPWIFTRFEQADGIPIGDEVLLGRCVELGKAN